MSTTVISTPLPNKGPAWAEAMRHWTNYFVNDFGGGPRPWKFAWVINFQKAGTFPLLLFFIALNHNTTTAAWIYLAMHGSYGLVWIIKDLTFPDRTWQTRVTIGGGINLSRDLSNEPPNVLYPETFAAAAQAMAKDVGLKVQVFDYKEIQKRGMRLLEELLRALKAAGCTVLMVSHNIDQVRRVADWVTVLDRSLVTEGPPAETLALDRVLALIPAAGEGRVRH